MADFVIPFDRLPDRFAESITNPTTSPVTPRPAATIVLMRDSDAGPEILLLRRNRNAGFVPGAYVFPGGRVDAADAEPPLVSLLDGLNTTTAQQRLGLADDAEPSALAFYLAAIREAFEETGILVARDANRQAPPTAEESEEVDALRDDLMEDRITFAQVLEQLNCRLDGGAVEYLAHWITPVPEPRRYDTRFFAAKVRRDARAIVDPREMTDAVWITARDALRRNLEGTLPMVFPTIRTLEDLELFSSANAVLADLRMRRIPTILPRLVVTPTGVGMELDE